MAERLQKLAQQVNPMNTIFLSDESVKLLQAELATTTDPNWTAFRAVSSGGVVGGTSRYAQYRLTLSTTAPNAAPALKEVALTFVR